MPPRSRVLPFIAGPVIGLTVLAAAACRPSRSGDGPGSRPLRIAVIPIGTTHEFWKSVHAGALAAARELGVEILWKGPLKEDDRNEQIQIVETLAGSGVDALVLSPLDDRALMRPVAEARRDGIPTVIFNSALQGEEHAAFIATDNFLGGTLAAREIGRRTGGRGRLIMVRLMVGVEGTTKREEGFLATLRAESTTFGCLRALQDHGLAGKIVHVGFDASEKLTEALAKGELAGLVLQDPVAMGYRSVKTAVAVVRGEPFAKTESTAVVLAVRDNMNEPAIARLLRPDLSILDEGR
jgi:ribose transport system substrate-binding protein